MATRFNGLRTKYAKDILDKRPATVDPPDWNIFIAYVRDERTVREIRRDLGVSAAAVNDALSRAHRALEDYCSGANGGPLTEDSPIESLGLSMRARNALRELGCDTVGGVLRREFSRGARRFGPVTRDEIASALKKNGFTPPLSLIESPESRIEDLASALRSLQVRIEQSHERWRERLEAIERRMRRFGGGSGDRRSPANEEG